MNGAGLKARPSNATAGVIASLSKSAGRPHRIGLRWGVLATAASLPDCATVNDSRYSLKDEWRAARIDEIGPGASLRQVASEDCRAISLPRQHEADRFAVVSYWSTVSSRKYPLGWLPRMVPLGVASTLRVGDSVYVNTLDCVAPVVARDDSR